MKSSHSFTFAYFAYFAVTLFPSCVVFSLATPAAGQVRWAQFRGPGGLGIAAGDTPETIGADNQLWVCSVGPGHSSPCIWGDRIFLTSHDEAALKTLCVDRKSGKILWEEPVPVEKMERTHRLNGQATPTPTTDGERVYVYFGSFGLVCYDVEGNEQWTRRLPLPENMFGTATSPIMAKDKLIFCCDMKTGSYLEAIDGRTGKAVWRKERPGFSAGWSSPMFWSHDGVDEIVVYGVWWLKAYNLEDGSERWSTFGLTDEPCITPVHGQGLVFVTSYNMKTNTEVIGIPQFKEVLAEYDGDKDGQLTFEEIRPNKSILSRNDADGEGDHPIRIFYRYLDVDKNGQLTEKEWEKMLTFLDQYEHENALIAIQPGRGDAETKRLWKHARGVPECPSPLYYEGRVYLIKNGGIMSCLDAQTGELKYQKRLPGGGPYYASPIVANDRIYTASARGIVTTIQAGDDFRVLASSDLQERIMATPALVDGKVYLRTDQNLYAFGAE